MEGGRNRKLKQIRILSVFGILGFCLIAILVRLYQLQVLEHEKLSKHAERQYIRKVQLPQARGAIFDRNMNEVAISAKVDSIYANPKALENPDRAAILMARALNLPTGKLKRLLSLDRYFVWVKRKVDQEESNKVRNLGLVGVHFLKENKRFYPKENLAAQLVGFCGIDNQGLNGLEYQYDAMIRGEGRSTTIIRDALGRWINLPDQFDLNDRKNIDLVLTLDLIIQHFTEEALDKQFRATQAKKGIAVVMQPWTGEILAMAERPNYNPNNFSKFPKSSWRSFSVTDSFEPGSTLKTFLAAAALETDTARPDDLIDCEMGQYKYGGKVFRESSSRHFDRLTVTEVISRSSNIGAIKLGERLGGEKYYEFIRKFGFGERTGIDLPGEAVGLVRDPSKWSSLSLASLSFGQEIMVTPIQLVSAMSAIANGGYLMRAHMVKHFMKNGKVLRTFQPEVLHRVLSPGTCKEMSTILRTSVEQGTGKNAQLAHFTVAGKTGTAQKIDPSTGTYSRDRHVASFLGFFPVEYPMFTILVMVDEPKGESSGGVVAAPVFREIAHRIARYIKLPSKNSEVYEFDWREFQPFPKRRQRGTTLMAQTHGNTFEDQDWGERREKSKLGEWYRRVFNQLVRKAHSFTGNEKLQDPIIQ